MVWVNKQLIQLSGVGGEFRQHVDDEVEQTADVRIGGQVARLSITSRRHLLAFPQTSFLVQPPPTQGETVEVDLTFKPKLWQGRTIKQTIHATVNVNTTS